MNIANVQVGQLTPTGEATASGAEYVKDRVNMIQHYPGPCVIDSATTDARNAPNTTLKRGLALTLASTGRWTGVASSSTTAKGILDNEKGLNLLDSAGAVQNNDNGQVLIAGLVDAALVAYTGGTAIDATTKSDLAAGQNGCNIRSMAT